MTREEAIAFGKRVIDLGFKGETAEFCEMAISALSENKGDLISREKLKDYLDRNISFGGIEKKFAFYDIIDSIPSADVRPNIHGHWEEDGHGHIICSACKEANVSTWKSRFCPMCGADMRGE